MTFYFYDLETTGTNPRQGRVMQFAGQRADPNLKPIGNPHNFLIKLTPDVLPEPYAVLTHGISPQKTLEEGITEAEFLKIFDKEIAIAGTVFVGFNNIRFDDEFMRFMLWRNFYDAYEWQWKDGSSRWDLLDVVRMARALRPGGIVWPTSDGENKLEVLAELNGLTHVDAHDASSDVTALAELARLIKEKQPKLFDYLLNFRDKNKLRPFIKSSESFIYTSGRYPKELLHTTVAAYLAENDRESSAFVFDLRVDPVPFLSMDPKDLAESWRYKPWAEGEERPQRFPVKELAYNRCAAIAPTNVLDKETINRLQLDMEQIEKNRRVLTANEDFANKILEAWQILRPKIEPKKPAPISVDGSLYDGFISGADKVKQSAARAAKPEDLDEFAGKFDDQRLNILLPLYKARNFPESLDAKESAFWQKFCLKNLTAGGEKSQAAKFNRDIQKAASNPNLTKEQRYQLEELNLYAQSIAPIDQ